MHVQSDAELSRLLGLSKAAVCRAKKRGMPTHDLQAARQWRDANLNPLLRKDRNTLRAASGYRAGVADPGAALHRVHALMELAASALGTASDHVHSLFHARWLLTDPPMGASVVVSASEEDRRLSESLLANADLLDRAAAMKERQKGPGNRATSTISAQCAAGLLHHLTRNGLPHSSKLQPVHNAAARWAWRYLNLPGDPLECIRTALRSEQPSQAGPAPKSSACPWDQLLDGR